MHSGLHNNYRVGEHYGCINQLHNDIYNNEVIDITQTYFNYFNSLKNKPKCFSPHLSWIRIY